MILARRSPGVTAEKWTCIGSVRGGCGVKHRSLEAAVQCCFKDQKKMQRLTGRCYSDRDVVPVED